MHLSAASGAQANADIAVQAAGAFLQDDQAVVAGALFFRPDADAVIVDPYVDGADAVLRQAQPAVVRFRMLDHVAEGFTDDLQAVHFLVWRQRAMIEVVVVLDLQARVGTEFLYRRLQGRFESWFVDLDAEGGQQFAQLSVGRVQALIDLLHAVVQLRLAAFLLHQALEARQLQLLCGQRLGEGIMQFASNHRTLLHQRQARLLLAQLCQAQRSGEEVGQGRQ